MHTEHYHATANPFHHGRLPALRVVFATAALLLLTLSIERTLEHRSIPTISHGPITPVTPIAAPNPPVQITQPPLAPEPAPQPTAATLLEATLVGCPEIDTPAAVVVGTSKSVAQTKQSPTDNSVVAAKKGASPLTQALQEETDPALYDQLERAQRTPATYTLVEAIIGPAYPASQRTRFRIGYGRAVMDYSNTVGTKNGTRLEEPGCLYVKTSLRF